MLCDCVYTVSAFTYLFVYNWVLVLHLVRHIEFDRAGIWILALDNSWAFCTEHAPNLARNPWGEGVKFNMAAYE